MRRREVMILLGGAAAVVPLVAVAQQNEPVRRIAVLMPFGEEDAAGRRRLEVVREALRQLGWSEGRNLRIEVRWVGSQPASRAQDYATELLQFKPEVMFTAGTPLVAALMRATSTIPIVFAYVFDPVGNGFVASHARPGGNATGFSNFEPATAAKWLELLKELAPGTRRALLLYSPETGGGGAYFLRSLEAAGPTLGVTPVGAPVRSAAEIVGALAAAAEVPGSGLVVAPHIFVFTHREAVVAQAARHRIPAIYPFREWAVLGGLISYGSEATDLYRRAAAYIDRILRGAHPSELPVQEPTTFELVINLKTAKALGLTVPPSLLTRADEVIE
jgi:putative tryptophan/tyrosine transport system substrate-binding protein